MKRMLIITDSLGLPRIYNNEIISFDKTWPFLLKNNYGIHHIGIGGGTIDMLASQASYYRYFYPDIVVIQSGIVDCAPRTLKSHEKILLFAFPLIRNFSSCILNKYGRQLRNLRNVTLTPLPSFKQNVKKIIELYNNKPVFFIGILPPCMEYEKQVKGISQNIIKYNAALEEICKKYYVDVSAIPREGILNDHHHLSVEGHTFIYTKLVKKLSEYNLGLSAYDYY